MVVDWGVYEMRNNVGRRALRPISLIRIRITSATPLCTLRHASSGPSSHSEMVFVLYPQGCGAMTQTMHTLSLGNLELQALLCCVPIRRIYYKIFRTSHDHTVHIYTASKPLQKRAQNQDRIADPQSFSTELVSNGHGRYHEISCSIPLPIILPYAAYTGCM